MYNPFAYYSPNNYGYGYTPPNAGYDHVQGTGTGTGNGFFHMPGAPIPTPAIPSVAPQIYYPQPQHGGRPMAEPTTTNDWTTTSENAYNWSNAGQNLMPVSPFFGAMAGMYGNYLARHVDPNYSHEDMRTPAPPTSPEGQAIIGPDGSVISASDPSRWGSETNPAYGGAPAANPMSSDPAQQAQAAQAAQAAAQAAAAQAASNEPAGPPAPDAQSLARNVESLRSEGESNPSEGNSLSRDTSGESGGAGKRGGLSKKGKIHPRAFADGGIVDLVRQYPWLLR
jgi:hypothetical protein